MVYPSSLTRSRRSATSDSYVLVELIDRYPFFCEVRLYTSKSDVLDKHSDDFSDTGRRRRTYSLRAKGVQGGTEFLTCGPVRPREDV